MLLQHVWRTAMSRPGLSTVLFLVKVLFCALIDSTAELYRLPNPKQECQGIKVNIWNRAKACRYYLDEIRCLDLFRMLQTYNLSIHE